MAPAMKGEQEGGTHPRGKKVQEFKVYWNKPSKKRVLVLQYPNRSKLVPLNRATGLVPLELRIKPVSGLIEVDIPVQANDDHYDKFKGVQYGKAIKESKTLQTGGQFGLSGGFGANPQTRMARDSNIPATEESEEALCDNFENAVHRGYALQKVTLGGRINTYKTGDPIYAIGIFLGSMC